MLDASGVRRLGSKLAIVQGLLTALVPRLGAELTKRALSKNFENADALEPKPAYLRQTRAFGVGLAAAGIAGLAMERATADAGADEADEADVDRVDADADADEADADADADETA